MDPVGKSKQKTEHVFLNGSRVVLLENSVLECLNFKKVSDGLSGLFVGPQFLMVTFFFLIELFGWPYQCCEGRYQGNAVLYTTPVRAVLIYKITKGIWRSMAWRSWKWNLPGIVWSGTAGSLVGVSAAGPGSTSSIVIFMDDVESDRTAECLMIKQITGSHLPPLLHSFPWRHSSLSIFWITLILNYDFESGRMWGIWRVIFLSSMWHLHHMDQRWKCSWEHWKRRK